MVPSIAQTISPPRWRQNFGHIYQFFQRLYGLDDGLIGIVGTHELQLDVERFHGRTDSSHLAFLLGLEPLGTASVKKLVMQRTIRQLPVRDSLFFLVPVAVITHVDVFRFL